MADQDSPAFVALVQATAGAVGGVFAASALHPLEVVKTRIQISQTEQDASVVGVVRRLLHESGPSALFQGIVAKAAETGAKNFVYFYLYDTLNSRAKVNQVALTTAVKLLLGYVAGVMNTILTMPLEVLATRCQSASGNSSPAAVLQQLLSEEGPAGLFKGFWFNIALCINPAIQNTVFDRVKGMLLQRAAAAVGGKEPVLTAQQAFLLGALAKAVATFITFPLVRLKTMLQAGKVPQEPQTPTPKRRSRANSLGELSEHMTSCSYRSDKAEAIQGVLERIGQLYRGVGSALTKSALQAALLYMTKEFVEGWVLDFFRVSTRLPKLLRRRSGRVKLGAFSGRPLPSDHN